MSGEEPAGSNLTGEAWGMTEDVEEAAEDAEDISQEGPVELREGEESDEDDVDEIEEEAEDETEEELDEDATFEEKARFAIISENTKNAFTFQEASDNYKEIDDVEVVEKLLELEERTSVIDILERRKRQLNGEPEDAEEDSDEVHEEQEVQEVQEEQQTETTEVQEEDPGDIDLLGGTQEEETDDEEEVEEESGEPAEADAPDMPEPELDTDDEDTIDEIIEGTIESEPEIQSGTVEDVDPTQNLIPEPESPEPLDVSNEASDAMTVDEAASLSHRWKILAWGPPGTWKTHMAFSMPEPVVFIDTEGKAHDIAHKFSDRVIYILQPENYEEVVGCMRTSDGTITSLNRDNTARGKYYPGALEKAIAVLDKYKEEQGIIGTLVVDSMSIMWEWSQQFYVDQWFDDAESASEANFKSAMADKEGSGDWKQIKNYHNAKFREKMLAEPYHLYWSAMSTEDYNQMMDEELSYTPMKPYGESKNVFKVDQIIRARFNDEGIPVGDLEKPGLTKLQYRGLPYPTFKKHRKIMQFLINSEREGEEYDTVTIGEDEAEITREVTSRG